MKKFLIFLMFICVGLLASAQYAVPTAVVYKAFNGVSTDTMVFNSDTTSVVLNKSIYVGERGMYDAYLEIYLKRAGSQDYVDVTLSGSLDNVKKTSISSVTWNQTTADTTIIFNRCVNPDSLGLFWKYLNLDFESDSLGADIKIPTSGNPIRAAIITRK